MKKAIILSAFFILMLSCFTLSAKAYETEDIINQTQDELYGIFDTETMRALDKLGLGELDGNEIFNVSLNSFMDFFSDDLKTKGNEALKFFVLLVGVLMLSGMANTVINSEIAEPFEILSAVIITLLTVSKLNSIINIVLTVLNSGSKFMISFIPIFGGLIALSGSPASALTYNTLALAFSEGISIFINKFAVNIIGGFYCLSICFSVNRNVDLSKLTNVFGKLCSMSLGLVSGIFASMLSIKGVMSASVDSVGAKGIRFILSSVIPIVGSAISDAYSSVLGSINLIKGSVAVIGIVAGLVINLPCIIEALLYYISLSLLSYLSDSIGCTGLSKLFNAFAVGIKFLLLLLILQMFILLISTGLMMSFKAAV